MKLDNKLNMEELVQKIDNAPTEQKAQAIAEAIQSALDVQKEDIVKEYRAMYEEVQANKEMAEKFGLRSLSAEEKDFYQKVTKGFYEGSDKEAVLPTTTLNYVFEDLKRARPLFNYIDFTPAGLQKWIVAEVTGKAQWGLLEDEIKDEIKAELKTIDLDAHKLSAFAFIPLGIIELGYEWVDRYVREVLIEANADGLELGYIDGNGSNGPVGMNKKLTGAVDGVYSDRDAVKITDFSPEGLGEVLAELTDEGRRTLSEVVLIVNPLDDFKLVKPASTFLTATGEYREVFPINTKVIQSVGVPANRAILYVPNGYQAGITQMGIYASDDFKFLDHARTYKVVTYGNGRLKKENMAAYLDISELKPLAFNVKTPAGETVEGA